MSAAAAPSRRHLPEREPELVSALEAARRLGGVHRATVYRLAAQRELDSVQVGSRRMIVVDSIEAYIERRRR